MTPHWDLIQGTVEWHQMKWGKIGGSASAGLLKDTETLKIEILSQMLEDFELEDGFTSDAMQRGMDLEPLTRAKVEEYTGYQFVSCGWIQSDISIMGISPDGVTQDITVSYEGKAPARKKHTATLLSDEIPLDNIPQCVHYFTVIPTLEKHYFVSFRPESLKPMFIKLLTRDSLVNMGTKAKPVVKSIREWSEIIRSNATKLESDIIADKSQILSI